MTDLQRSLLDFRRQFYRPTPRGNGIVVDPFAGSGSTVIACEMNGRLARCVEMEPAFCDVIVRRSDGFTGKKAELGNA